MTKRYDIIDEMSGVVLVKGAKWCDSFGTKLRGFTFRKSLEVGEGLVLVDKRDNRISTGIHMMFVGMDLGVVWVNDAGIIVDTIVAKPWKLSYTPKMPARYVIEAEPHIVAQVKVGDKILFNEVI